MTGSNMHFQPLGRKTPSENGKTVLELARDAGVSIESVCGSAGKCGKCKVIVRSGSANLSPPSPGEVKLLGDKAVQAGARLACQAKVVSEGDVVVEVPEGSRRGHHRLLAAGEERATKLMPAMTKTLVGLPPATLADMRADDDRFLEELQRLAMGSSRMSPGAHKSLPGALRDGSWSVTATLFRGREVVRVDPGDTTKELFGVAADIGTTKVVAYLIDLTSGRTVATESMPNPQIPFGEDVMSRITYSTRTPDGNEQLQKVIIEGLNSLISKLSVSSGVPTENMLEVVVVGNTAMHHLFFGIPAKHLATAPYAPAVRTSLVYDAGHMGLDIYPFGKVSSLPNVAGFVGADAVAGLVSSGLYRDKDIGMMIDIGTNTEIIAGNRDRLVSCSCASGPAFEGAHIRYGMRASTGAIERVWIDPASREVKVRTVDDGRPRGICGSGIVDAIAEMFKSGIVSPSGRIVADGKDKRVRKGRDGTLEYVLAWGEDSENGDDVAVAQHDVEEIQLAKAAIFTGVYVLMRRLGVKCRDLRRVYAAGAFGTYVDATSAITIGMYPDVPVDRIRFIGNAAGSGARMALKSTRVRDLAERLSKRVEYVELAAEKDFQQEFAKAMFLPHRDASRFPSVKAGKG
ncbi:MAG: ASKHA domain-containing protein [Thermoplasmata archaeon]